jgi:protein-S-isoprenylcysteine O-methyltransferase Ste14
MSGSESEFVPPPGGPLVRIGDFFFQRRNAVVPVVTIGLFAAFPPVYPADSELWDLRLDAAGIALGLAGQLLRAVVIGLAYIRRGGKEGKVYASSLVTEGFFNHARNPLYVGNIMMFAALLIVHNNPWVYALGIPFVLLMYRSIVASEENYLRAKFGVEYDDYCRRVNRWLPRLRGLCRTMRSMEFHWRRLILKEHGTTYSWVLMLIGLLAYERIRRRPEIIQDFPHVEGAVELYWLGGVAGVATVLWLIVRVLKKKRFMIAD